MTPTDGSGPEWWTQVRSAWARERYGWIVTAVMLGLALWIYGATPGVQRPVADGFYSYLYARSLAFDGDVDFGNDYALCGDPFAIGVDRGTGHPDNLFYPGPALVWAVPLLVARWFAPGADLASTCGPPWTTWAFLASPLAGAALALLSYRLARRWFSDGVAALATALVCLAGPAFRFSALLPSYSHIYDALAIALVVSSSWWAADCPARSGRWGLVALALGVAVLQRLSNAAFVAVPIVAALRMSGASRRQRWLGAGAALGGMLAGLGVMGQLYAYLYGSAWTFTHGRYFLHPLHPHPFLLLFDAEEGLFLFAPAVWLSVIGLVGALRHGHARWHLLPLVVVAGFELWLASAALDWAPARRLTNLTVLWVVLAAFPLRSLRDFLAPPQRSLVAVGVLAALPFVVHGVGFAWGVPRQLVPTERPVSQSELYGSTTAAFWHMVAQPLGNVALLPGEALFRLRYGLPGDRLGEAAFPRTYWRDFRSLQWQRREIDLLDEHRRGLTDGFSSAPSGLRPAAARTRLVFAAQWPYATHVTVFAAGPGTLRVGRGRWLREPRWFGSAQPLSDCAAGCDFSIPAGGFASGINELVFTWSEPESAELRSLRLDDRAPRPAAFGR